MTRLQNIKRVAIIGGGPAGVAIAKYLEAEKRFPTIDVYEQRSTAGGVWNYTPENDTDAIFAIPSTTPDVGLEQPVWRKSTETNPRVVQEKKKATFISPLYERLEANLPKMLMQHTDFAFPDDEQLFPTHAAITEYLERYADEVRHLIKFSTQVTLAVPLSEPQKGWSVTTRSLTTSADETHEYDAVAVAGGHYTVPFIPDIPGISEWNKAYPGRISHSKFFRRPEEYKGQKVIVIGSGYSGQDIAQQIEPLCSQPLLHSTRSSTPASDTTSRTSVPSIAEFVPATSSEPASIRFTDGRTVSNINAIIFATGYLYAYPFLPPALTSKLTAPTSGARTSNTYQHIFYTPDPTLALLALPQKIVPFPVSQSQAAVIARVWSGRLALPEQEDMVEWERKRVQEMGNDKRFHYLTSPEDIGYVEMLAKWAESADGESEGRGKTPPRWGQKQEWMRMRITDMKRAFVERGEKRREVKTLEEIGFDYEKWKGEEGDGQGIAEHGEIEEKSGVNELDKASGGQAE